jgi:hypothetical protein
LDAIATSIWVNRNTPEWSFGSTHIELLACTKRIKRFIPCLDISISSSLKLSPKCRDNSRAEGQVVKQEISDRLLQSLRRLACSKSLRPEQFLELAREEQRPHSA